MCNTESYSVMISFLFRDLKHWYYMYIFSVVIIYTALFSTTEILYHTWILKTIETILLDVYEW